RSKLTSIACFPMARCNRHGWRCWRTRSKPPAVARRRFWLICAGLGRMCAGALHWTLCSVRYEEADRRRRSILAREELIGLVLSDTYTELRLKILAGGVCGLGAGILFAMSGLEGSLTTRANSFRDLMNRPKPYQLRPFAPLSAGQAALQAYSCPQYRH